MLQKSSTIARAALAAATLLISASSANAAAITFAATGSGSDGPLAASASFTTSNGQIIVVLSNTLAASVIRSAGQAVSDISFTLSNAAGTLGATSVSGQLGNASAGTPVSVVSGAPSRWLGPGHLSVNGSTVSLEVLGGGQPDQMIAPAIGAGGVYGNLNNGFDNFNPYVIGPATFTLALSGVTAATTVTSVNFSFGTGPDTFLPGASGSGAGGGSGSGQNVVPEPASLLLLGSGLIGVARYRRRR